MEIFYFLTGLALGLISTSMKRLLIFIRLLLSSGTTFIILRILHPTITLRPIAEWTWYNLFHGYNFWGQSIILLFVSFLFFYWLIPFLFKRILFKRLSVFYQNYFKKLDIAELKSIKKWISNIVIYVIRILKKIDPDPIDEKVVVDYVNYKKSYYNSSDSIIDLFSLSIHLIICWIFIVPQFIPYLYILFFILILIFVLIMIGIPFVKNFVNIINKTVVDELNRNIKQFPE